MFALAQQDWQVWQDGALSSQERGDITAALLRPRDCCKYRILTSVLLNLQHNRTCNKKIRQKIIVNADDRRSSWWRISFHSFLHWDVNMMKWATPWQAGVQRRVPVRSPVYCVVTTNECLFESGHTWQPGPVFTVQQYSGTAGSPPSNWEEV